MPGAGLVLNQRSLNFDEAQSLKEQREVATLINKKASKMQASSLGRARVRLTPLKAALNEGKIGASNHRKQIQQRATTQSLPIIQCFRRASKVIRALPQRQLRNDDMTVIRADTAPFTL
jgi:hypothetical protein